MALVIELNRCDCQVQGLTLCPLPVDLDKIAVPYLDPDRINLNLERGLIIWKILSFLRLHSALYANFFEVMTHLDNPWSTLGWVKIQDNYWTRSQALQNLGAFLTALVGSCFTGLGLGFGNKFWHDILGIVYEMRDKRRELNKKLASGESPHE